MKSSISDSKSCGHIEKAMGTVLRQAQSGGHRTVSLSDTSIAYDLTYLYDARGSVAQTVTDNIITASFSYDPFGNTTTEVSRSDNYYGYNSEETNSITGLQYLRARYYSSDIGKAMGTVLRLRATFHGKYLSETRFRKAKERASRRYISVECFCASHRTVPMAPCHRSYCEKGLFHL